MDKNLITLSEDFVQWHLRYLLFAVIVIFFPGGIVLRQGKSSPITGLDRPIGFQEVKVPRFRENGTGWW